MTSVPQQATIPSQDPSSTSQSTAAVQSQSTSGTSSPLAAVPGRSSTATKKFAQPSAHGKSDSISPAVPALSGPDIANGNNAINSATHHSDHSRKSSVTISAAGTSGQMPNGGPVAGKPAAGNGIQFGQMNANSNNNSPNVAHSAPNVAQPNPAGLSTPSAQRMASSPSPSPSPIPQPTASGGRPPSSLHGQGSGLSFGSLGGGNSSSPMQQPASLTPNMQSVHLRRESSQSSHADVSNGGMVPNGGRGGYPSQSGRGRGYGPHGQQYPQGPMMHSPSNSFRGTVPNAPRGGQSPYTGVARPMANAFPNSPHQAARSPSLAASQPVHQQPGPMPMHNPQMHAQGYYPMQHQQIPRLPPNSPPSDQVGQFLMSKQQGGYMPQGYGDPYYYGQNYMQPMQPGMPQPGMMQPGMGMPQYGNASPRPQQFVPAGQPPYVQSQYGQPQPMSRTPSGVSERPASTVGPTPTPATPASSHQPSASRSSNSPAPSASIQKPAARKSAAIVIKDPNSGAIKTFNQPAASPAPSKSPANSAVAPTPPPPQPKTPSNPEPQHTRADSQAGKSKPDLIKDMQAAVRQKIKEDEEKERLAKGQKEKVDDVPQQVTQETTKEPEKAETKSENVDQPKPTVAEPAKVDAPVEAKSEAKSDPAAEPEKTDAKKDEPESTEKKTLAPEDDPDCDEYWAKIEAEEEAKEREREEAYQKKKAVQDVEKKKKEAEEAARLDEEMKKAEREAEQAEEARMKKKQEEGSNTDDKDGQKLFAELAKNENAFKATKSGTAMETPAESGTATPVSDTSSMGPPSRAAGGKRQPPAALKLETSKQVEPPQPSAALQSLRSAKFLTNISKEMYPSAIQSPNPALNSAAPMGKFRYDKDFLLQFQKVFVEKPSETWSEKLKETVGDTSDTPQSTRPRGGPGGSMTPRQSSRTSVAGGTFGTIGNFNVQGRGSNLRPGTTSAERYNESIGRGNNALRYNPNQAFPMGFPPNMSRTSSSTGHPNSPGKVPSSRGNRGSKAGKRDGDKDAKNMPLTAGLDIKPIQVSETGWKPQSVGKNPNVGPLPGGGGETYLTPDIVQRKVKSNLNKMTPSTFDKIATQILEIVAQSQRETDGRTLRQVIGLTFEKATDEAHWSGMYAEFCARMLQAVQQMQPEIKDETLPLDKNGKVNAGGTLFRKYLLNRCQQDFEAGWKSKLPDQPEGEGKEAALLSDEYYAAEAAKRRGLGLVKFIGELYKLGMLTSRIMHMCVKRLLDFEGMPDEAEVESLASLLKTVGANLDSEEKARPSMDAYFERINYMMNMENLPSRLRFMLLDIIDLRKAGWKGKQTAKGPTTIEEVRAQAAAEEAKKEAQRQADNSRRGGGGGGRMHMGRGDARNFSGGNQFPPQNSNTVGMDDLRRLGKRQPSSQGGPTSFGPPSMFNTRGSNSRKSMGPGLFGRGGEDSGASSRTGTPPQKKEEATHANAFSALASLDSGETNDHPGSPPSSHSSPNLSKARPAGDASRSKSPLREAEKPSS